MFAETVQPGIFGDQSAVYRDILDEGGRQLRRMGFQLDTRLNMGDPGAEICAIAKDIQADLVVIGHRQHGSLARWWSGSVATFLLDHLHCSLLIGRMSVSDADLDITQDRSQAIRA